jgi:hypothetical protein
VPIANVMCDKMGLFDFVITDLTSNTRVLELEETNTKRALYAEREQIGEDVSASSGVIEATVGLYLAYLVAIGFLSTTAVEYWKENPTSGQAVGRAEESISWNGWARDTTVAQGTEIELEKQCF